MACAGGITKSRCRSLPLLLLTAAALSLASAGEAQPGPPPPRITIVVVPGLRAEDLAQPEAPHLQRLITEGAWGWMVCRAARPADTDALWPDGREPVDALMLTLGAGARARCGPEADGIVSPTPHNLHVLPYPPPGSVGALIRADTGLDHSVPVGAIGDIIHAAGLTTVAIGNMDSARPDRSIYLLAMDHRGVVDAAGARLGKNLPSNTAPFGITANIPAMVAAYDGAAASHAIRFVAIGELYRADLYEPLCVPELAAAYRSRAVAEVDDLVGSLMARIEAESRLSGEPGDSRLILLSPAPANSTRSSQDRIAPLVFWGGGVLRGTITSDSTRASGLVTNCDFAATIANWLHQPLPAGAIGRPITVLASKRMNTAAAMVAMHNEIVYSADIQNRLGGLPILQAVLVLIGLIAVKVGSCARRPSKCGMFIGAAIAGLPSGMLLLPQLRPPGIAIGAVMLGCYAVLLGLLAMASRGLKPLFVLCGVLVASAMIDLFTGGHLMRAAWMSYSATDGSRFYGIGNEYMGAVTGAMIVLCAAMRPFTPRSGRDGSTFDARGRLVRAGYYLAFAVFVFVMAAPFGGAKAGAIPSAGIPLAVMVIFSLRGKLAPRDCAIAIGLLCVCGVLIALIDRHGAQTHLIRSLSGEGGDNLLRVAVRKAMMEARLLRSSPWMFTLVAATCALWMLRRDVAMAAPARLHTTQTVMAGLAAAGLCCLLFNDAGVLAASTALLYGCAWSIQRTALPCSRPNAAEPEGG